MGRKRGGNSGGKTPAAGGADRVRVNLTLRIDTAQRLGVHASMTRADKGAVADEILAAGLKRFRTADFGDGGKEESDDRGKSDGPT